MQQIADYAYLHYTDIMVSKAITEKKKVLIQVKNAHDWAGNPAAF